jgi:riboflavin transporter FmnP
MSQENKSVRLTGTAILAALVIVFDYTLKFSGLKIPFPWYPVLKFDFTGVPIALSFFLYGFPSSAMTSIVAGIGIMARSGDPISASMKVASELSTVFGLYIGEKIGDSKYISWGAGLASRVIVMSVVNLYVLPNIYRVPREAAIGLLPLIGVFNLIQGGITIGLGRFLYQGVQSRLPRWMP